jgi:TetR/AcrR family transcriptional regulator
LRISPIQAGVRAVRPPLSPDFIAHHKKLRLASGAAATISEKGFLATTVDDIVRRARLGRNAFYESFGNKDKCIEWAHAEALRSLFAPAAEVIANTEPGRERLEAVLKMMLEGAAADPTLTELCLTRSTQLRDRVTLGRDAAVEALTQLLEKCREPGTETARSPLSAELTAGAIAAGIAGHLREGGVEKLAPLGEELADLAAQLLFGEAAAASSVSNS